MSWFYAAVLIAINVAAIITYRKLLGLRSASQIQAEIELEMHRRAHQLLVARDRLEVGLVKDGKREADEKWKEELAEYMEEFEQEALLREKKRLRRS